MKRTWSEANAQEYGQLGIIESVKLRNFMCHENLSFDFDPHMNFIIGRNGSGKSAVLTGIILALGGKSSATGRYANIKGFVKTGKNTASVSVTLKNSGPDAYKPDDYGEKITIERHFNSDGVNSYKLKSESGRIISSSKEDLTSILDVMDIQVENPVTVLVQDISKTFLLCKNSKGHKLFDLFYEGTGLSKVHDHYNRALQQNEDAKSELQKKKAVLVDMEKDAKAIKTLLDRSAKINELNKELLWAIVIKFEQEESTEVAALEKIQNSISDLNKKLDYNQDAIGKISQSVVDAKSGVKESEQKMASIRKLINEDDNKRSRLKTEVREIQGTRSRHEREFKRLESEITGLENIMNAIRLQNQQDLDEEKLKHEHTINELQSEISDTLHILAQGTTEKNRLLEKIDALRGKVRSAKAEINDLYHEKKKIEREKEQIINGMKNRLNVFGMEMEAVRKEIKLGINSGIFKKAPIGPIGLYIDVRKPEWNFAIQECLKMSFLRSFVCDNHEDSEQLSKIFSKYFRNQQPSVIISKFSSEVYDVNAHKCVCQYPTVLDMLKIENPVVTNCLIDEKSIENILLVDDPAEARNLTLHNPPRKCSFIYSINGDQFCYNPVRKYSCRNKSQFCILKSFQTDDLKRKDEETKIVDSNISEKKKHQENLLKELNLTEKEDEVLSKNMMATKFKEQQLRMKLKEEENSYTEPKDINNLQTDLDNLKKSKADHEQKLVSCEAALEIKNKELNTLDEDCEKNKGILQTESEKYHNLAKQLQDSGSKKEKFESSCNKIKSRLAELQQVLKAKEEVVLKCKSVTEVSTKRALNTCPRIDTERSVETLRSLIDQMKSCLQAQRNVDREGLLQEYTEKVANLNKAKTELCRQEKINNRLVKMITQRCNEFKNICNNTKVALTCAFITLLQENDFKGYLNVDFDERSLNIFAKPTNTNKKFTDKPNLCQLSGGERSYVTIAFLLSLWDRIHSPFRILDEYDVFMDSNNRHRSIHLLINTAKSNKKIQYIFLSPLELPHIEDSDHVKVHKMTDPRSELKVNGQKLC